MGSRPSSDAIIFGKLTMIIPENRKKTEDFINFM